MSSVRGVRKIGLSIFPAAAQQLASDAQNKQRISHQVALPQTPWLRGKPMQPFQTETLHPNWCASCGSRMEIKRGTNPNHDGGDLSPMFVHPQFLLGTTQAYKHNART
jgi:hypothetical protein